MARYVTEQAQAHPYLEVVQEPTLSIACIRYVNEDWLDLDYLNQLIHREMVHQGISIPSTAMINGKLAIRPCFIGARTSWPHSKELIEQILATGERIVSNVCPIPQYCLVEDKDKYIAN
jgi:glutamate/tyrosine decarboxylase-like PLP-dependent enzyme